MADTGAPWNLPYPLSTDLVRDGAQAIQDLAEATADAITASGLVTVKHVIKTDPFSASATGREAVAVTGLSITHEVADPTNLLIISAFFGSAANDIGNGAAGIAVAEDGTLIGVGTDVGSRTAVGAGGKTYPRDKLNADRAVSMPSVTFVHTPGAGSKVYTVRVVNISGSTNTLYVNQSEDDTSTAARARSASALVIQEVKVA